MRYITICHELLQDQYPTLHEKLRNDKTLLNALKQHAIELKSAHVAWMNELRRVSPKADYGQIASEALELAIEHLQGNLPCECPPDETAETHSLGEAMEFVRSHTPPA
jgi:hypothetical protein